MDLKQKVDEYYLVDGFGKTKLQKIIDAYLINFGGLCQKDYDDFYSVGNECFVKAMGLYDGVSGFDSYIKSCIINKLKTEMTRRNRKKRSNVITTSDGEREFLADASLDATLNDDSNTTYGEMLEGQYRADEMVENELSAGVQEYLKNLTETQRKICDCIMDGLMPIEIKEELNLEDETFSKNMKAIKAFKNTHIINRENFKKDKNIEIEMESVKVGKKVENSCEKNMTVHMSVGEIIRKMNNESIRFDYPGQRESEQWPSKMQSELISDILQGNHIPDLIIAEEVINGHPTLWNLDGKQRCTTIEAYKRDVFPISRKVKRYIISYSAKVMGEDGKHKRDEDGMLVYEWKQFDIRNKRYSQLPDELKDQFNYYHFDAVQYINCSRDEIDYHISRYNEGKQMTKSQKGMSIIGCDYAMLIKAISSSDFFKEYCNLGRNDRKNGVAERIVGESIMAGYFTDDWKKDQTQMFVYLRENCTSDIFNEFGDYISDLEGVMPEELADVFTTADTFIWLGAYIKSCKMGYSAQKFTSFFSKFCSEMMDKKVDGKSFNDIIELTRGNMGEEKKKSTKDSVVVADKINTLVALMKEYYGIKDADIENKSISEDPSNNEENTDIEHKDNSEFIRAFIDSDFARALKITNEMDISKIVNSALEQCPNIDEDTFELYLDILNDWTLNIPYDSEMLKIENIPSIIKAAFYICEKELDSEGAKWFMNIDVRWKLLPAELKTGASLIGDFDGFIRVTSFDQAS